MNAANKEAAATCDMDAHTLSSWFDGEAGVRGHLVEAHLRHCQVCPQRLAQMRRAQGAVVSALEQAMGPTESLLALKRIRERITHRAQRGLLRRLVGAVHDAWLFKRPALAGAAAVLVLSGAALGFWHAADGAVASAPPGVVVESLHVETNAKTHVSASPDRRSTLIWIDTPPAGRAHAKP